MPGLTERGAGEERARRAKEGGREGAKEGGNWAGAAGLGCGSQCVCRSPLALRVRQGLREQCPLRFPRPEGIGTWGPRRGSGGGEGRPVSLFGYLAV